jgi:hypothetical protein
MDQRRFDAALRAMQTSTTRRAGLAAALAALLGSTGLTGGAVHAGPRAEKRGGKRKRRTRPGSAGPCGDGSRADNRCTRDSQCCTGVCETSIGRRNLDGDGRCRCRRRRQDCTEDRNCCGKLGCYGGRCSTCRAGCSTGCCAGDTCIAQASNAHCGRNGDQCVACPDGSECLDGACEVTCKITVDPLVLVGQVSPTPAGGASLGIVAYQDRIYFTELHVPGDRRSGRVGSMNIDGTDLKWSNPRKHRLSGIAVNPANGEMIALEYREFDRLSTIDPVTLDHSGDFGVAVQLPFAAAFDTSNGLWISLDQQDAIRKVYRNNNPNFVELTGFCGGGATRGPRDFALGPGDLMFATCFDAGKVVVFDPATNTKLDETYPFADAYGIAFNGSSMYVVASSDPVMIQEVTVTIENGNPVFTPGCLHTIEGRKQAGMATVDSSGKLWVSRGARRIKHKSQSG